jgi:hypothetical protein
MQETALHFFDEREREIENHYRKQAGAWFQESEGPFWEARSEKAEPDTDAIGRALDELKRQASIRLQRAPDAQAAQREGIEGREVVLRDALIAPGMGEALDFVSNVEVVKLVEMAPRYRQVPDLFEAYNRAGSPVSLEDFLKALATLLAAGVLRAIV